MKNYGTLQITDLKKLGLVLWNKRSKIALQKGLQLVLVYFKATKELQMCRPIKILGIVDNEIKFEMININGDKKICLTSIKIFNKMVKDTKELLSHGDFLHWPVDSSPEIEQFSCQVREILIPKK